MWNIVVIWLLSLIFPATEWRPICRIKNKSIFSKQHRCDLLTKENFDILHFQSSILHFHFFAFLANSFSSLCVKKKKKQSFTFNIFHHQFHILVIPLCVMPFNFPNFRHFKLPTLGTFLHFA